MITAQVCFGLLKAEQSHSKINITIPTDKTAMLSPTHDNANHNRSVGPYMNIKTQKELNKCCRSNQHPQNKLNMRIPPSKFDEGEGYTSAKPIPCFFELYCTSWTISYPNKLSTALGCTISKTPAKSVSRVNIRELLNVSYTALHLPRRSEVGAANDLISAPVTKSENKLLLAWPVLFKHTIWKT